MNEECFASEEEGKGYCRQRAKREQREATRKLTACSGRGCRPSEAGTQVRGETGGGGPGRFTEAPLGWVRELEYYCCFLFLCIPIRSLMLDI